MYNGMDMEMSLHQGSSLWQELVLIDSDSEARTCVGSSLPIYDH